MRPDLIDLFDNLPTGRRQNIFVGSQRRRKGLTSGGVTVAPSGLVAWQRPWGAV